MTPVEKKAIARLQDAADQIVDTDSGEQVFKYLFTHGRLRDIEQKSNTWMSQSFADQARIEWGTGSQGDELRNQLYFGEVDEEFAKKHRLLHEMGHLAMIDPDKMVRGASFDLSESMRRIREYSRTGLGMTALGSSSLYSGRLEVMRHHEDAAELFGMLTHNEERYRRFMNFVQDDRPGAVQEKNKHGIVTLSRENARVVNRQVRIVHEQANR